MIACDLAIPGLAHGEYWTLPVRPCREPPSPGGTGNYGREEMWSFSPMIDLSLYRWVNAQPAPAAVRPPDPAAGMIT